jgi:TRAP-type C4-dicarboxylate transport system substrate-binding protein
VYTALERNIVDGCTIPWEGALAFKFYEVAKYHTTMDLGCGMFIVAMNQKTWKKLPPDIQKILEDLSSWAQKLFNDSADATDEKALSVIQKAENTIIRLTPQEKARWVKATKPVVNNWAAKLDDRGLPGTAIVEEMIKLGSN